MTHSEVFDYLEAICGRIGMMCKDGDVVPHDMVMAKVGKRFPEDDTMLWDGLQAGTITPDEFAHHYEALIAAFRVEYLSRLARMKLIDFAGGAA